MIKNKRQNKILGVIIIAFIISLFLVSISVLIPAEANSYEELKNLKFGLPIPYMTQDLSFKEYLGGFPHRFSLNFDFLDHVIVIKFDKSRYIASIFLIWILLLVVYHLWTAWKET